MYSLVCVLSLIGADYKEAFELADQEKEPLVLYIGAEWCGPCLITRPILNSLYKNYVYLDADVDGEKIKEHIKYTKKDDIPQIIMWKKKNGRWLTPKVIFGGKNKEQLEEFLEINQPKIPE